MDTISMPLWLAPHLCPRRAVAMICPITAIRRPLLRTGVRTRMHQRARGEAEHRPPGIHLWRLYDFRPIRTTQIAERAASESTIPTAPGFPQPTALRPSAHA